MRNFYNFLDCRDKFTHLRRSDHQGRRDLQHHEIVSTNLREDPATEETHHQNLPEHGRMNLSERFEWRAQCQTPGSCELNAQQQAFTADLFHHLITAEPFRQSLLQFKTNLGCTIAESFAFENIECRQTRAHG